MDKLRTNFWRITEIALVILGFALLFLGLALYAPGGPLSTDVFWYMNVGINRIKDTFILNRYFHVYLQAIFLKLAPTPQAGLQYFWAFLMSGACLLAYLGARNFSQQSRPWHGILAALLLLSIKDLADNAGVAWVDLTAMFMVALIAVIFLFSLKKQHGSTGLLLLLGGLFFLAFKTKETTLVSGLLFVGLGFDAAGAFDLTRFGRRLGILALGALGGVVFFAILSWIFLGDPFFGLRPAEFLQFGQTYVEGATQASQQPGLANWYSAYIFSSLLFPFFLYILSGLWALKNPGLQLGHRLFWLVPLALVLFVTLTVGNQWGFLPRFMFPVLPILCLLGPQFMSLEGLNVKENARAIGWIVLGFAGLGIVLLAARVFVPRLHGGWGSFLATLYLPFAITLLLALTFLWKPLSQAGAPLLVLALLSNPLVSNFKTMVIQSPNKEEAQRIFYPFSAFASHIHYTPDMRFYVAKRTWYVMGVAPVAKDGNEIASIFNVYFRASSTHANYTLQTDASDVTSDIFSIKYTYVLLSLNEWQMLDTNPDLSAKVTASYQVVPDGQKKLYLLVGK